MTKSSSKTISHTFYLSTFQLPVHFMANCPVEKFIDKMRKRGFESSLLDKVGAVDGLSLYSDKLVAGAIWIKASNMGDTLQHECYHLVFYIFQDRDTPINEDTLELYILHAQDIYRGINEWLEKRGHLKGKKNK